MNELFWGIYCAIVGFVLLLCFATIMGIVYKKKR